MSKRRFVLFALVAVLVLSFAGMASAAARAWTGDAAPNTDWGNDGNWDGGDIGGAGDTVTIPAGSRVTVDADTGDLTSLTIGGGSTITIEDGVSLQFAEDDAADIVINALGTDTVVINGEGSIEVADDDETFDIGVAEGKTLRVAVPIDITNGAGTIVKTDTGTLELVSAEDPDAATDAALTIAEGTVLLGRVSQLAANQTITIGAANATAPRLILNDGNYAFNAPLAATTRTVTFSNVTTGTLAIAEGATVTLGGATNPSIAGAVRGSILVSGDLRIENTAAAFGTAPSVTVAEGGSLTVAAIAALNTFNTLTGGGDVVIQRDLEIQPIDTANSFEFSGDISGAGGLIYDGAAAPAPVTTAFTLSGTNTYQGDTVVATPVGATVGLRLADADALPSASVLVLGGDAGLPGLAANSTGRLTVSGDVTLYNDIIVNGTFAGTLNVPDEDATLTLAGELDVQSPVGLVKAGPGELRLDGFIAPTTTNQITVNTGTLTLAADGVADGIDLTINANTTLDPATAGQTHTHVPGPGRADVFGNGVEFIARLTDGNKIASGAGNPYFHVDGRLLTNAVNDRVKIVATYDGSMKKDELLLVLDYTLNTGAGGNFANANNFRVVDAEGNPHKDFKVEDYYSTTVVHGIALRANKDIDATEQPGAPSFAVTSYDGTDLTLTFTQPPAVGALAYTINHATFAAPLTGTVQADGTQTTVTITEELSPANGYTVAVAGYDARPTFRYAPAAPAAPTAPASTGVTATYSDAAGLTFSVTAAQVADAVADGKALSAWVWLKSGSEKSDPILADLVPAASGGYTVTVSNAAIEAAFPEDDYPTLSVSAVYQLTADSAVTGETEAKTVRPAGSPKGSSGGCDAGFGLFGLLAATGAVALLRRKG